MVFPGISVSKKCNPFYKKINSLGAQLDAPKVEISLDVMKNPKSELLTPFPHFLCYYCFSLGLWLWWCVQVGLMVCLADLMVCQALLDLLDIKQLC